MADLDYGYEITIETPGTSSPAATPTNQWQRKASGSVWVDIAGETGETYTVVSEDQSHLIRLVQDFGGAEAYSNELQVTSNPAQPSPCETIYGGPTIQLISTSPLQGGYGEGDTTVIVGKDWLKYLKGYSVVFGTGETPPNLNGSNSSGQDQIFGFGKTSANWVIVTKVAESWISTTGHSNWIKKSSNVFSPHSGGTYFTPKGVATDGNTALAIGVNQTGNAGSGLSYSTDGRTWSKPSTSFPSLTTSSTFRVSAGYGYYACAFGNDRYYNTNVGSPTLWTQFSSSATPGYTGIGAFGHLGMMYQLADKYYIYNPWTDTSVSFDWPWLKEAGNGFDITGVSPKNVIYSGGIYFVSASAGVAMSTCNGLDWKLHRNNAYKNDTWYQVNGAFFSNQNSWHFRETYGFGANGSVSSLR